MNNSDAASNARNMRGTNERKGISVSPRIAANRRNALKSTGPKSPIGKAYSRRNALKHGLFVSQVTDFEALHEDPREYENLLNGLWDQYQPIGKAEEIEVERIAVCCWRLRRVWRYENAVNLAARRDVVRRELDDQEEYCKERDKEERALVAELEAATKEIEEEGEISHERKQRMFVIDPGFQSLRSALEEAAQEWVKEPQVSESFQKLSPQERLQTLAMYTVTSAIACLKPLSNRRWTNVKETAVGQHAIPSREVVDKILRYETTIERSLQRAQDRLERLQRRRAGESLPPALSVHLTR